MMLLQVEQISGGYGGLDILNQLSLEVDGGEIVVLIGPNGAGKSTAMKAIFGLLAIRSGKIKFAGSDITQQAPDRLVQKGLAYVPQERNIFPHMSVLENLEMGAYIRPHSFKVGLERAFALFPPLKIKARAMAGELSGGQRQMVAMARALMLEPKMLLLDEPTAGLSPLYMEEIFHSIQAIHQLGTGVLLVEQNARQALTIAHRGYVLIGGQQRHHGPAKELLSDPKISLAFLGGGGNG